MVSPLLSTFVVGLTKPEAAVGRPDLRLTEIVGQHGHGDHLTENYVHLAAFVATSLEARMGVLWGPGSFSSAAVSPTV